MYAEQPSTDQLRAIEEIKRLRAERDKLIQAVADHVTVRAEQYQKIQALEAQARDHLVQLGAERNRALKAEQERDALRAQVRVLSEASVRGYDISGDEHGHSSRDSGAP